jgi:hypothetical protein
MEGIRTINALKRINEQFRWRTETRASLLDQVAVLLLYVLLCSG